MTASAKVLVVGVAAEDRDALERQLRGEGHVVELAGGSEEALDQLRAQHFDVVMVYTSRAGGDSERFVSQVRGDAAYATLPIIALVATEEVRSITRWLELGVDDYLPRGFTPAILRPRLRAALDRRDVKSIESLTREMAVARNIQQDFLPESLPQVRGVDLEAALHPARDVSGDFYDAFTLPPNGTIVMVVGDVCDKGVGAALFMALFRSLIRASADPVGGGAIQMIGGRRTIVRQSLEAATPADLLTRCAGFTNDYIARLHGRTNMFATVFLAALDPNTGYFDYVNCGHEPALVIGPDGILTELRPTGPALGLLPEQSFTSGQGQLMRDQCLFAFTDGLVEARSPSGEAFGTARLKAVLRGGNTSAAHVVQSVAGQVRAFAGSADPHDDLTLLAATRTIGWTAEMAANAPVAETGGGSI